VATISTVTVTKRRSVTVTVAPLHIETVMLLKGWDLSEGDGVEAGRNTSDRWRRKRRRMYTGAVSVADVRFGPVLC
jgi:hypothetical protein